MKVRVRCLDREFDRFRGELLAKTEKVLSGGVYFNGPETEALESAFAGMTGKRRAVSLKNCTDALFIALVCLGIGAGDEVIVPCNTFMADYLAVRAAGAVPVPADADGYFNIDAGRIEEKIGPKTKAVIAVHLYGQAADMDVITEIGRRCGLYVIEDCAQATGALYKGRPVGSFGDAACFSFYPTKNLGSFGDGGMVCVDDDVLADRIRTFGNYGLSGGRIVSEGINSRMDELQAGLLNVKLAHLDELLRSRREAAGKYLSGIDAPSVTLPLTAPYSVHTYHQFVIQCTDRDGLRRFLDEKGVGTQIHYETAAYLSELYSPGGRGPVLTDCSRRLGERVMSLPIYYGITDEELSYVIDSVNEFGRNAPGGDERDPA